MSHIGDLVPTQPEASSSDSNMSGSHEASDSFPALSRVRGHDAAETGAISSPHYDPHTMLEVAGLIKGMRFYIPFYRRSSGS